MCVHTYIPRENMLEILMFVTSALDAVDCIPAVRVVGMSLGYSKVNRIALLGPEDSFCKVIAAMVRFGS